MPRGLVALSASAVAAIYMAGYLRTQAADASIGAADVAVATMAPVAAAAPPAATATPQPFIQRRIPVAPRQAPTPSAATIGSTQSQTPPGRISGSSQSQTPPGGISGSSQAQTQATYKDGTFSGEGTSRRGDLWVNVQVQAGKITNVTITRTTLQYPLRDIANLPSEVLQRQSPNVDIVSRATYSSLAFKGAVTQALADAH